MSKSARKRHLLTLVAVISLLVPSATRAADQGDHWAPIHFLLGSWQGGSASSVVTHSYEMVLQDRFIQSRTRSETSDPGKEKPAEIHEDIGFFSYDPDREVIVFRQFLSEGYVNTYTLDPIEAPGDRLVFTSEATEGAGGMRARLTILRSGPDAYEMLLDLASPGQDFFTCQRLQMNRINENLR